LLWWGCLYYWQVWPGGAGAAVARWHLARASGAEAVGLTPASFKWARAYCKIWLGLSGRPGDLECWP
jgi:hypothetical protein